MKLEKNITRNSFNKYHDAMQHINKVKSGSNCTKTTVFKLTQYLAEQLNITPDKVKELALQTINKLRCS